MNLGAERSAFSLSSPVLKFLTFRRRPNPQGAGGAARAPARGPADATGVAKGLDSGIDWPLKEPFHV